MEFNRTKNSTRTFVFGIFSKIVAIAGPFITRTIIIYKLGTEYLGLSSLFTSVLSILNISELGIGSAITFCLYRPVAENDRDTVRALLSLLRRLYKIIGGLVLGLGLALIPFLPNLIHGDYPQETNIYVLYLIYLLNACVSYLGFAYKGVLFNVYQRGDITHKIAAVAEIIKYALQVGVLLLFGNYYWFAAMLPVSTIFITIATQIKSKIHFPDLEPIGEVDKETKNVIKKKVMFLSAHSIAAKLTNSVDNIVISGALGLTAIGLYGNYNYISTSVLSILLIAYGALTPVIGNSLVSKSKEDNDELFDALYFLCFWTVAFCTCSLLCLYQPFMILWVGQERTLSFTVVIMVCVYFYSNATRQLLTTYVGAAGLWDKTIARQIIAAAVNLVLDLLLVKTYGIAGIVFASFATNAFIALPMDVYVTYKYILKKNVSKGVIKTFIWFVLTVGICTITYFVCTMFSSNTVITFLEKAVVCILVPNIIVLAFSFKFKEFKYLKTHIRSLIRQ